MAEENEEINLPTEKGWYWVRTIYNKTIPCWFMPDSKCFLPGGIGDSSSMGIHEEDIEEIGPKIEEPEL